MSIIKQSMENAIPSERFLIASIGNARIKEGGYEKTSYYSNQDPDNIINTPYILHAIRNLYSIDKLILIGTTGSDWYNLYEYLYSPDNTTFVKPVVPYDPEYSNSLLEAKNNAVGKIIPRLHPCDGEDFNSLLTPLIATLGESCFGICLLDYGITEEELTANLQLLLGLLQKLEAYREEKGISLDLYLDITHSFRSLPVYQMMVMNLAREMNPKNLRVQMISYGMHEVINQNNKKTPIVDLSQLTELTEWQQAVYEYKREGSTAKIAELLNRNTPVSKSITHQLQEKSVDALKRFGNMITNADYNKFKILVNQVANCIADMSKDRSMSPVNALFYPVFEDINKRFAHKGDDLSLRLAISDWHYEYRRYLPCVVMAQEAIIDYSLALLGRIRTTYKDTQRIRKNLKKAMEIATNNAVQKLALKYEELREIRNDLCHGEELNDDQISSLGECIKSLSCIYEHSFRDNTNPQSPNNREDLKRWLSQ